MKTINVRSNNDLAVFSDRLLGTTFELLKEIRLNVQFPIPDSRFPIPDSQLSCFDVILDVTILFDVLG
jgi:hypothetical protein